MIQTQSFSLLPRNGHSAPFIELRSRLQVESRPSLPLQIKLMRFIVRFRSSDGSEPDIEMAVREALANAVIHGNGESSYKRIHGTCGCYMDGEVSTTVRDEGRGFDNSAVLDPNYRENLLLTQGRGIYLMKTLLDEVAFEKGSAAYM